MIEHRILLASLLCLLGLGAFVMTTLSQPAQAQEKPPALLRHVVLFKFKPEVTKPQVQEVVDAFGSLPKKIDTIAGFEWGTDVSTEMKSEGYSHCFVVSFQDAKARDEYLPHAAHAEFVKLVGPRIEKVLVFDFVNGK